MLELKHFGNNQKPLIESNNINGLLELLASKQQAINRLTSVKQQLSAFESEKAEQRTWRSETDRQKCSDLIDESEQLLAQIIKQEKLCEESITMCKHKAEVRLKGATHASSARDAYSQFAKPSGKSLDLSTEV